MPNLWPFVPLLNISETLDQFSNVFVTRVTEQRLALRYKPRQTFTYGHQFNNHVFARAKAFAEENDRVAVYVPVWLEAVRLGGVQSAATVLNFDTTYGDWRVGAPIVIWQAYDEYVVRTINAITTTSITLSASVGQDFQQPYVIPVRTCLTKQGYQFQRTTLWTRVTCVFSVTDNVNLIPDGTTSLAGYPTYLSLTVLPAPPFETAQTNEFITMPTVYFDNGFGPQVGEATRIVRDFGQMLSFLDNLGPDLWARRRLLHWIRGKQVPFWFPSFNKDLQPINPIGAADVFITVRSIYDDPAYYIGRHIMILLKNGTRYFRQITGSSSVTGGDSISITALGAAVSLDALNLICFMSKVRSETDSFTWTLSTATAASMTMPVLEVQE